MWNRNVGDLAMGTIKATEVYFYYLDKSVGAHNGYYDDVSGCSKKRLYMYFFLKTKKKKQQTKRTVRSRRILRWTGASSNG